MGNDAEKIADISASLPDIQMHEFKKKWFLDFDYAKYSIYWTRILSFIIIITVIMGLLSLQVKM